MLSPDHRQLRRIQRAAQDLTRVGAIRLGKLIDEYGLLRAIKARGFRAIDHDYRHRAVLWAREAGYDPWLDVHCDREAVLELVNSTAEDGRRAHFAHRVPTWMISARQAVAWHHHLEAHQYRPMRET